MLEHVILQIEQSQRVNTRLAPVGILKRLPHEPASRHILAIRRMTLMGSSDDACLVDADDSEYVAMLYKRFVDDLSIS